MKTLSHLQNEAIERFEKEFCRETGLQDFPNFGETMVKEGIRASLVTDFLKTELETIVKESFKNTRVEESELIEKLADIEHTRWAKWQQYFFSKCLFKKDVGYDDRYVYFALPKDLHKRWERQINTPYAELSEAEKESDRKEARISLNQALSDKHNKECEFLGN